MTVPDPSTKNPDRENTGLRVSSPANSPRRAASAKGTSPGSSAVSPTDRNEACTTGKIRAILSASATPHEMT